MKRWAGLRTIEQPLLNGDSAFTVPTETMPNPHGPHCKSQKERAEMTIQFMKNSLQRHDFIGWHIWYYRYYKNYAYKGIKPTSKYNVYKGKYYLEMERALQYISNNLYNFTHLKRFKFILYISLKSINILIII